MKTLRQVGLDEVLTEEQGKLIRERAVMAARRQMVARKLLPLFGPLGEGVQVFGYDTMAELSAARIDLGWPGAESRDLINLARTTVAIPNLHKEFEINKLDLASSRMHGQPLNLSTVDSASYKVSLLEDELIIKGWSRDGSNYDINGLYEAAGNDYSTAKDFGTATNIPDAINGAIGLLLADSIYPPYNVVLNPTQYAEALVLIANTAKSYLEWIRETIQGEVYVTPAITDGNGMMVKANPEGMFEYVLAEDVTVYNAVLLKSGNLFGRVYVRGIPVVYDANSISKLSSI